MKTPRSHSLTRLIIMEAQCKYKHENVVTYKDITSRVFANCCSSTTTYHGTAYRCQTFIFLSPAFILVAFANSRRKNGINMGRPYSLITRAIHIEIVHSYILGIRNFTARRGVLIEFHSDNGTNFNRAETELKQDAFVSTTTNWKFIPQLL